eukprot:1154727-Pelagomonas_calceolata.AAC.1
MSACVKGAKEGEKSCKHISKHPRYLQPCIRLELFLQTLSTKPWKGPFGPLPRCSTTVAWCRAVARCLLPAGERVLPPIRSYHKGDTPRESSSVINTGEVGSQRSACVSCASISHASIASFWALQFFHVKVKLHTWMIRAQNAGEAFPTSVKEKGTHWRRRAVLPHHHNTAGQFANRTEIADGNLGRVSGSTWLSVVKMYNSMLRSNGETLKRVLKADLSIHSCEPSCWTAQVLDAFQSLRHCDSFVRQGTPIPIQEFVDDLRNRLRTVWRDVEGVNLRDICNKLATFQSLLQPFDHNVCAPARLPGHMHLDLSQHVMRHVSRFRLGAHTLNFTLKVETAARDARNALLCDRCSRTSRSSCDEIQDEAHALLVCRDANVCALRRKYAYLFNCVSGDFSMVQPFSQQASVQD